MKVAGFLVLLACGVAMSGPATADSRRVAILVDASKSNPMVDSDSHAARVANDITLLIGDLELGDWVMIETFGDLDPTVNIRLARQSTLRFKPEAALRWVHDLVAGFPEAIRTGEIKAQDTTNIAGALNSLSRRVDCSTEVVDVYLATDGHEDSAYGKTAPEPDGRIFEGCASMTMVGVIADDDAERTAIGEAWVAWCEGAGFLKCAYQD